VTELVFKSSAELTMGVEIELQCLNTRDYDLSTTARELLRLIDDVPGGGEIKPELTQSMIEVNSAIHHRHDTLLRNLRSIRDMLVEKAELLNVRIAGGGTHPFQMWSDRRIFEGERYEKIWERYGYLAKQFTVFGQHIHLGCPNGDTAIRMLHLMSTYIPTFIALSAASPFYQDQDTKFASSRLTSIDAFPLSGTIPFLRDWKEFCDYYTDMAALGIVKSMKDFYWDIRPKPEYGTIEVRICDTPLTVEKAAALAALAQTLALRMLRDESVNPDERVYRPYRFNRFNAARYGLRGDYIDAVKGTRRELGEFVCETLDGLWDYARELGTTSALKSLYESAITRRNDANLLRDIYAETGSLHDVARRQAEIWALGRPAR